MARPKKITIVSSQLPFSLEVEANDPSLKELAEKNIIVEKSRYWSNGKEIICLEVFPRNN